SITVAGNLTFGPPGGVFTSGGVVNYRDSAFAFNSGANFGSSGGTLLSNGHNISSDGTGNLFGPGDLPNTDPLLGPLADNGGPTKTRALLFGSPAINAGDAFASAQDQRGVNRMGTADIGAYEADHNTFLVTNTTDSSPGS